MKKLLLAVAAIFMTVDASAQLISSNTVTHTKGNGYSRLSVSYNSLSTDKDLMDGAMTGFSLAWTKGISVSSSMPLFIETGLSATYAFKSETMEGFSYYDEYSEVDVDHKFAALTVPVSLVYKYEFPNTSIKLAPFAGIYFRGNLYGETSYSGDYIRGFGETSYIYDGDDTNWFDDNEDGGLGAKRLSFGWQVGVGLESGKLYLGVSYGSDFTNLIDFGEQNDGYSYSMKSKVSTFSATLGINF